MVDNKRMLIMATQAALLAGKVPPEACREAFALAAQDVSVSALHKDVANAFRCLECCLTFDSLLLGSLNSALIFELMLCSLNRRFDL